MKTTVQYYVLNENTLGYVNSAQPGWMGVLAGSVRNGGHSPLNGPVVIVPGADRLRPATHADFDAYRVSWRYHLPDPELTHCIKIAGREVIRGDAASIHVVFNNLTGCNFQDLPSWREGTHALYLHDMGKEWLGDAEAFAVGLEIELVTTADGATVQTARIEG